MEHTGNSQGAYFRMSLVVTSRGSSLHASCQQRVLNPGDFISAGLADIDSREHWFSPGEDTNKEPYADRLETIIRDNTRRNSGKMDGEDISCLTCKHEIPSTGTLWDAFLSPSCLVPGKQTLL